ncbi:site-2 protease family protein [Pseudacidobacterium ailaaui]|jgi:Zn-dependent protease|uniref:site-2 protease family protein n=1 Tax=Pseudacidobacterium ailaaui TaxID=1382359 RepID=UPI00047A5180|nr:site-2 protease family protein [Pseudacidobacterium ailaaui]
MSQQEIVLKIFEFVVLLFALSLHEAAHAWMAARLGDPTARMLGRVTLNPAKHIDLLGTILIPLAMLFLSRGFLFGWAKPTPVTTRNFKNIVRDDILSTLAGPVSNVLAAVVSLLLLAVIARTTVIGNLMIKQLVMFGAPSQDLMAASPIIAPLVVLLYLGILLNLFLAAFNLLPLPPLDGSHILRHMLPYSALRVYDSLGMISLVLILFFGGPVVNAIVSPALYAFNRVLLAL